MEWVSQNWIWLLLGLGMVGLLLLGRLKGSHGVRGAENWWTVALLAIAWIAVGMFGRVLADGGYGTERRSEVLHGHHQTARPHHA